MGETPDTVSADDSPRGYPPLGLPDRSDTPNTSDTPADADASDETVALRADIEQTRTEMSATIDAIQEKLNPQNIVDQAKETVREATVGKVEQMVSNATDTARETGSSVLDLIQQNPIPAALAGLGIGWLLTRGGGGSGNQSRGMNGDGAQRAYSYRSSPDENWQVRYYDPQGDGSGSQNPISQIVSTVRQNPIPAALAGLGVWMLMNRAGDSSGGQGRSPSYDRSYGEPGALDQARNQAGRVADKVGSAAEQARDTAGNAAGQALDSAGQVVSQVQDTAGQVVGQVQDTAGQLVGGVQERVSGLADETQYRAEQAKSQIQRMLEENPLMVGVMAATVGVAVGLALPETPQEHQLLGEMRDNLLDKAQTVVQDTAQKVQQVATQAQQTVQQEAQAQGLTQ